VTSRSTVRKNGGIASGQRLANWRATFEQADAADVRLLLRTLLDGWPIRSKPLTDGRTRFEFEGDTGIGGLLPGVVDATRV